MVDISSANTRNTPGKPLQGGVALVTGGSRGIGKAIARELAALGAAVSLCGRDKEKLMSAARELETAGAKVLALRADVTKEPEIRAFVEATEKQLGGITMLVNNAGTGGGGFGAIQEKSEAEWDQVMNTNLKSVFFVSRAVIPGMIQRRGGDIINISSLAGKNTFAGGGIYCASKWGLQGLSGCMAEDLRAHGIRVSVICPGSVATEFMGRGPKDPSKILTPEDVAHAVAMVVTQGPQSFISEVHLRPVAKP
ncbi:MAG TPA: SDR family NAD(P)-dependent oxidoreductase [Candidatus Acidoferrales bacterium]|jgi:3-oxoacyl-[acyl-carrier protein] reductase|nr:SDR family NAD(P)-dependent oxidoreductase [Candidatus Acidoferrales bacterium]